MPTSAPGSSRGPPFDAPGRARRSAGFTLLELLIVMAVVAVGLGLVALALPDGERARLEEEAERLAALIETARAESRVSGAPVFWRPRRGDERATDEAGQPLQFRFVGLPKPLVLPTRWLDPRTEARVVGAPQLVLGPEAILPPQRVQLSLGAHRLELASDGLAPFGVVVHEAAP
ncbi:MAG: prepilin-type N-terminal cleavage/methylation domain-containing protein [Ideonella sp. WA131b]|jgi:general secretion pathway protein H|nr:prepilin-type N-terminal cleavage/methylation domain-containing protein [Ideonella sp. WA131b]